MTFLIVQANATKFFDTPSCPPWTTFFLPMLFFLNSSNYNKDTFFRFVNSRSVKKFSFSFFSLVNAFTWLSTASYCFLWRNNVSIHFLFVVSQISTFCLKFCNFSSCNFSHVVLPLSSSLSSCSFWMSTLFFCSAFALFFLQISTLCLYPSIKFLL